MTMKYFKSSSKLAGSDFKYPINAVSIPAFYTHSSRVPRLSDHPQHNTLLPLTPPPPPPPGSMLPPDLPSCFPEGCPITDIVHCSSLGYSQFVRSGDIELAPPHCMLWQCLVSINTLWWHAPSRSLLFLSVFLWPILCGGSHSLWANFKGPVITANEVPVHYINVLFVTIVVTHHVGFDWDKKHSFFNESQYAISSTVQRHIYQDSAASYQLVGSYFSPFPSPAHIQT